MIILLSKKHLVPFISISIFCILTTAITLLCFIIAIRKIDVNTNTQIKNEKKYPKYLVKSINNKINIFEDNNKNPSLILEKSTIFLPEFDQKMLNQGIAIDNIEELRQLIEDFDD